MRVLTLPKSLRSMLIEGDVLLVSKTLIVIPVAIDLDSLEFAHPAGR